MSLKLFKFTIENTRTRETACLLGQGATIEEAFKEGVKNAGESFRPSSSGKKSNPNTVAVTLSDGRHVTRTLKDFEGDVPFDAMPPERSPANTIQPYEEDRPSASFMAFEADLVRSATGATSPPAG